MPAKPPLDAPDSTAEWLFRVKPYSYQHRIFDAVFIRRRRKITIRATTRAGKSFSMAEIGILKATFLKNHRVGIIAPTHPKTRIIMNYIADLLAAQPHFDSVVMVSTEGLTKLERLRKEVSKNRITFKNGSSIEGRSVDLDARGFGALGFAYDTIIVDETDLIDDASYAMIYRMLVESADSQMIEIGNPWQLAHFYEHHHNPEWEKITIAWEECVSNGRMTQEAVDDQRRELTELEFRVLFDAEFPDEVEHAIFPKEALQRMIEREEPPARWEKVAIGIDVARGGRDVTVITDLGILGNKAFYITHERMDTRDIMTIVGAARTHADGYAQQRIKAELAVDTVGNGAGVYDRIKELGGDAREFIAGEAARNTDRFYNAKTETAFKAAELAKAGLLRNIPPDSPFTLQCRAWTYEVRSDKKIKLVDPESKSPDYADSLIIALSRFIFHEELYAHATESPYRPTRDRPASGDFLKQRR